MAPKALTTKGLFLTSLSCLSLASTLYFSPFQKYNLDIIFKPIENNSKTFYAAYHVPDMFVSIYPELIFPEDMHIFSVVLFSDLIAIPDFYKYYRAKPLFLFYNLHTVAVSCSFKLSICFNGQAMRRKSLEGPEESMVLRDSFVYRCLPSYAFAYEPIIF